MTGYYKRPLELVKRPWKRQLGWIIPEMATARSGPRAAGTLAALWGAGEPGAPEALPAV